MGEGNIRMLFDNSSMVILQQPRFVTTRADTLVYASGDLLIDSQTGKWRRYSFPLRQRVKELCAFLNMADSRSQQLRVAASGEVWPEGLVANLSEYTSLIDNWQKIAP